MERYQKAAQYKKVAELADEFTASSTALEHGLKVVKEFSSRVLEKPWSGRFTETRPEIHC